VSRQSVVGRLGAADKATVPVRAGNRVTEIDFIVGRTRLDFGLGDAIEYLARRGLQPSERAADLLLLSALITAADTRISRFAEAQDRWTREIDLHVPVSDPSVWNGVTPLLTATLNFLTGDRWALFFRSRPKGFKYLVPGPRGLPVDRITSICLLSGGLDSFIGAIDLLASNETPMFVSHYWDGRTSVHQDHCLNCLRGHFPRFTNLRARIGFPSDLIEDGSTENTLRGRSFLFFALATLAASSLKRQVKIYVPENGFISLNVPLDPLRLGALSTRTTHPYYLARWNDLLSAIGIDASMDNPYRFKTKGAMVSGCKDSAFLKKEAKNTMSCSHPDAARYTGASPGHCGRCVPCLIRRGALQAGFGSDDTYYQLASLAGKPLDSGTAEGVDVRSFQLSIAHLKARKRRSRLLIHQSGPLHDYSATDVTQFEAVYIDGLAEVESVLQGVVSKPH
jgi:hypothetical protein